MKTQRLPILLIAISSFCLAGERNYRVISIPAAPEFSVPLASDDAYAAVSAPLVRQGYIIAERFPKLGILATELEISGSSRQTGTQVVVAVLPEHEAPNPSARIGYLLIRKAEW